MRGGVRAACMRRMDVRHRFTITTGTSTTGTTGQAVQRRENAHPLRHFILKMINLPRQARQTLRNAEKEAFPAGVTWTTTQALVIPQLRKSGQPEPNILVVGAFLLTCGRLTLASAYTVPLLIFGELLVVSGAATCFTITSSLLSQAVPSDQVR